MKVVGYITGVGINEGEKRNYPYVEVEGLRISIPDGDGLYERICSLPRGREYTFVVRHRLYQTRDGGWRSDVQLIDVES